MDFTPASQNGIQAPSEYKTLDSTLAVLASTTATYFGNPTIIKAVSNASMYKTKPVSFYAENNGITRFLGSATFFDNVQSVIITADLQLGVNNIYATWPGENRYSAKTTYNVPYQVNIISGNDIGGSITLSVSPESGTGVDSEFTATLVASLTTSTSIDGNMFFYVDGAQVANVPMSGNQATTYVNTLTAGTHLLQVAWMGTTIDGVPYAGKTTSTHYVVAAGTTLPTQLALISDVTGPGVIDERLPRLRAVITTSSQVGGLVTFYRDGASLGSFSVSGNQATLAPDQNPPIGSYTYTAHWDGNPTGHPRFTPMDSNSVYWTVNARHSITSMPITFNPTESVRGFDQTIVTAHPIVDVDTMPGDIQFFEGPTFLGTASIVNTGGGFYSSITLDASNYTTGTHIITARYSGSLTTPKIYPASSTGSYVVIDAYHPTFPITITSPQTVSNLNLDPLQVTVTANTSSTITGLVNLYIYLPAGTVTTSSSATNIVGTIDDIAYSPYRSTYPTDAQYMIDIRTSIGISTGSYITINSSEGKGIYSIIKANVFPATNNSNLYLSFVRGFNVIDSLKSKSYAWTYGGDSGIAAWPWRPYSDSEYGGGYWQANNVIQQQAGQHFAGLYNFQGISNNVIVTGPTTSTSSILVDARAFDGVNHYIDFNVDQTFLKNALTTGTYYFQAYWSGGYVDDLPFYGNFTDNISSSTFVNADLNLRIANTQTVNNIANLLTVSASQYFNGTTSTSFAISSSTVYFYDNNSLIGTATNVGMTATFSIPAGQYVSAGTNTFTATWLTSVSNKVTATYVLANNPTLNVSLSNNPFYHTNANGSKNTSTTATITISTGTNGRYPTGTIVLYDAAFGSTTSNFLGTATNIVTTASGRITDLNTSTNLAGSGNPFQTGEHWFINILTSGIKSNFPLTVYHPTFGTGVYSISRANTFTATNNSNVWLSSVVSGVDVLTKKYFSTSTQSITGTQLINEVSIKWNPNNVNGTSQVDPLAISTGRTLVAYYRGDSYNNSTSTSVGFTTYEKYPVFLNLNAYETTSPPSVITIFSGNFNGIVPTGMVSLYENGSELQAIYVSSTGTFTFNPLSYGSTGAHNFTIEYHGDSNFSGTSTNVSLTKGPYQFSDDFKTTTTEDLYLNLGSPSPYLQENWYFLHPKPSTNQSVTINVSFRILWKNGTYSSTSYFSTGMNSNSGSPNPSTINIQNMSSLLRDSTYRANVDYIEITYSCGGIIYSGNQWISSGSVVKRLYMSNIRII